MHQTGRRLTRRGSGRSVFYTPSLYKPYLYKTGGEHEKAGEASWTLSGLQRGRLEKRSPMKDSAPPPMYHNHHTTKKRLEEKVRRLLKVY